MLLTWFLVVFSLMNRRSEISELLNPSAISLSTSSSRSERSWNTFGSARRAPCSSRTTLAARVGKLLWAYFLEYVRESAGPDGGEYVLVVVVGGEYYNVRAWGASRQAARSLHAVHARHDQVHQRHVGRVLGRETDGLFSGARLGDNGDVALCLEERPHPLTH